MLPVFKKNFFFFFGRSLQKQPFNVRPRPTNGNFPPKEVDEYAGLMTKKEKDWIIKIQLLQLQTENPYLDDFYYTVSTGNKLLIIRKCYRADGWAFLPML